MITHKISATHVFDANRVFHPTDGSMIFRSCLLQVWSCNSYHTHLILVYRVMLTVVTMVATNQFLKDCVYLRTTTKSVWLKIHFHICTDVWPRHNLHMHTYHTTINCEIVTCRDTSQNVGVWHFWHSFFWKCQLSDSLSSSPRSGSLKSGSLKSGSRSGWIAKIGIPIGMDR
jgi:hypothetical protein